MAPTIWLSCNLVLINSVAILMFLKESVLCTVKLFLFTLSPSGRWHIVSSDFLVLSGMFEETESVEQKYIHYRVLLCFRYIKRNQRAPFLLLLCGWQSDWMQNLFKCSCSRPSFLKGTNGLWSADGVRSWFFERSQLLEETIIVGWVNILQSVPKRKNYPISLFYLFFFCFC